MPHSEQYIQLEVVVLAFPSLILDRVKEEPVCRAVSVQLRCELAEHTMHFVNRYTWVRCSSLVRRKCVEVVAQLVNRLEVHLEEREVAAPCEQTKERSTFLHEHIRLSKWRRMDTRVLLSTLHPL